MLDEFEGRFLMLGDTISKWTMGEWENEFSGYNDSLLIFVTERQNLMNYFEGVIKLDNAYDLFVVTYKQILENNWIVTIPTNK